jgi:uncharacterized protein
VDRQVFINLPVKDLRAAKAFYVALGWSINPAYTDENAACVVMGGGLFAMLHTHDSLKRFTTKSVCDSHSSTEVLVAVQVESKEEVDRIVAAALKNGGSAPRPPQDHGFVYYHPFEDIDGHTWEPMWLAPEPPTE